MAGIKFSKIGSVFIFLIGQITDAKGRSPYLDSSKGKYTNASRTDHCHKKMGAHRRSAARKGVEGRIGN